MMQVPPIAAQTVFEATELFSHSAAGWEACGLACLKVPATRNSAAMPATTDTGYCWVTRLPSLLCSAFWRASAQAARRAGTAR
jgi:hypothetical protein